MVRASYLQIYNDQISDLLRMDRLNLQIREDKKKGIFVENLSEWAIRNPQEVFKLIQKGATIRATASTKLNSISSRSHAIFMIIIEQMKLEKNNEQDYKHVMVGKLNLVDLAGSERARITGATGVRLEECKKINQSLSSLGNVISALTETGNRLHIPYRDSKITRILEDSLGGNCKTTFMAMVSPAVDAIQESVGI
jgi:kinesin family protein 3/17